MEKIKEKFFDFAYFSFRWVQPIFNPLKILYIPEYFKFVIDWIKYSRMKGAEPIHLFDTQSCLGEKNKTTKFDQHYFYQDVWAFQRIYRSKVDQHVDVGSRVDFVGFLSTFTKVIFVDIRPIETNLKNLKSIKGDILSLPFEDNSISSLSCLHVAEHIGLGRYGDRLDPLGTKKACQELTRVLAKNGNLYFSVPVGKPKLCFNAHRIHSARQILDYFSDLELVEFSGIDDQKNFKENIDIDAFSDSKYACGLFWFRKR